MLINDLRFALRQLRKSPGFSFTVVLTLALSVGVATAVFCVVDAVILRPLPYAHPERIVALESRSRSGYTQPASWPSYADERTQAQAFSALAGYTDFAQVTVETPSSGPLLLDSVRSTDNFFQVFGVQPLLGRTYVAGEEAEGKNDIAGAELRGVAAGISEPCSRDVLGHAPEDGWTHPSFVRLA